MRTLYFDKAPWQNLQKACEQGYPREVCGLLFAKESDPRRVRKIAVLKNILDGSHADRLIELIDAGAVPIDRERALQGGFYEFYFDPRDQYREIFAAQKEGLDQIGVFHSHPDHPAEPSPTDASQPMLALWSNIIAAVHKGNFKEARSWFRENEIEPFQEEKIVVE